MSAEPTLAGRTALVTGASRGIGRAIALAFAEAGALVCVHYAQSHDGADETVRRIIEAGGRSFAVQAQLGEDGAAASLIDRLGGGLSKFGEERLDILVNNAGIGVMATIADTDETLLEASSL